LITEVNEFVERNHNSFLQVTQDFIEVCPKCQRTNISSRQRKTPKYHCQDCKNEFDNPKAKIVCITQKQRKEFGKQYSNPDQ
jgi:ribosomal protein L37AE/L43A